MRKLLVAFLLTIFLVVSLTGTVFASEKGLDNKKSKDDVNADLVTYTYYWKIMSATGPYEWKDSKKELCSGDGGADNKLGASIQESWQDSVSGSLKVSLGAVETSIGRTVSNSGSVTVSYTITVPDGKTGIIYWQRVFDKWTVKQGYYRRLYYYTPEEFTGTTATCYPLDYKRIHYSYSFI